MARALFLAGMRRRGAAVRPVRSRCAPGRSVRRSRTARRGSPRRARRPFRQRVDLLEERVERCSAPPCAVVQARGAVRVPALGFVFGVERLRKVARAVAEQQFVEPRVVEAGRLSRQLRRRQRRAGAAACGGRRCRRSRRTGLRRRRPPRPAARVGTPRPTSPSVGPRRAQCARRGAAPPPGRRPSARPSPAPRSSGCRPRSATCSGALVLIGSRATPSGSSSARENRRRRMRRHVEREQLGRVERQVPDDDLVLVGRVRRERPHHREAAALDAVHARDVQEGGRPTPHLGEHRVLAAQLAGRSPTAAAGGRGSAAPARSSRARPTARRAPLRAARPLARVRSSSLKLHAAVVVRRPFDAVGPQRTRCSAPRRAGPSGRSRSAIRARRGRSGCARTGSA